MTMMLINKDVFSQSNVTNACRKIIVAILMMMLMMITMSMVSNKDAFPRTNVMNAGAVCSRDLNSKLHLRPRMRMMIYDDL